MFLKEYKFPDGRDKKKEKRMEQPLGRGGRS